MMPENKLKLNYCNKNMHKVGVKVILTFIKGIVEPPRTKVVNKTMIRVVVIITCLVSSLNSKWRESAYDIAPRRPEVGKIHKPKLSCTVKVKLKCY